MLGYGLINSSVHEFCIRQLIINFFNRSSLHLLDYYAIIKYISSSPKILEKSGLKIIDDLFDLFLKEELLLSSFTEIKASKDNKKINIEKLQNEQENLYKYILSANIIQNKDYNYDLKNSSQVLEDGKNSLKIIFENIFKEFMNSKNMQNYIFTPKFSEEEYIKKVIEFAKDILNVYSIDITNMLDSTILKSYNDLLFLLQRYNYLKILDAQINSLE